RCEYRSRHHLGFHDISYRKEVFGGKSDYWSLARPVFFSSSPGLIFLIMSIPVSPVPDVARAIGIAWIAISTVIAAKTALGLDTQRSLVIFIMSHSSFSSAID